MVGPYATTLVQVLVALPIFVGVGLLADPERMLLLHDEFGTSPLASEELHVRRWRARGAACVVVGALAFYGLFG